MFLRKKVILFLSSVLLVTSYGSIANAEQIGNNENYQFVQSHHDNEEFMVKNILDANGQLENLETGEVYELEVGEIKVQKLDDFMRIQTNETATQYKAEAVISATTHTQSGNKTDDSISLKVYATIYYTSYSKDGFTYVGMDKIDYRFDLLDSSVTVSNKRILVSQNGGAGYTNGGKAVTNQQDTLNAFDSDTILVRNWGWDAVLKYGLAYACGINITATLQRGTHSSWNFVFNFPVT
ncbi:hypothetical protein M0651_05690 [Paenibacillus sp. MBLB2552]|uniref:WxL domain-containing protein n=2 Tax=Paenibacillus TaxID=44249 RepID=A0A9X2BQX2_9BACL|nr:hypothetical protein [Paenibacillus mellifer]MCK8486665.1 hypothetical protein [Paenibacillus mellifer]